MDLDEGAGLEGLGQDDSGLEGLGEATDFQTCVQGCKRTQFPMVTNGPVKRNVKRAMMGLGALNTNALKYAAIGAAVGYLAGGRKVLWAAVGAAAGWFISSKL